MEIDKYKNRFKDFDIEDLVLAFNSQVGNPGWVTARGHYLSALISELRDRSVDLSAITTKGGSVNFAREVGFDPKESALVPIGSLTPKSSHRSKNRIKSVEPIHLVFQWWEGREGVFIEKLKYTQLRQVEYAIVKSKNWGEFRALLPEGEFEALSCWWENGGENVYQEEGRYLYIEPNDLDVFWEECGEEYLIREEDRFDDSDLPGRMDGDYPPWTYSFADDLLPEEFVKVYGKPIASMISGSWIEFPVGFYNQMKTELEKLGFLVERSESDELCAGLE